MRFPLVSAIIVKKKAVELLEQGRGVFWNQITRLRSPLGDVIASGQEGDALADEFTRLSSEIRSTIYSEGPDQHNRLCSLNVNLQSTITKIRKLPGLAKFLLPLSFSELQNAASGGPVVIVNASQYTCDALVVFFDRDPVHIPLQITKSRVKNLLSELQSYVKSTDVGRDLVRFLRVLWDEIVSPIADFLQTTVPSCSRIWWCPTAEFCLLPLHAAGPYQNGQRNFSHLYISSYALTLTALIRTRRNDPSATTSIHEKRFLAVGQASAKGEPELPSVSSELTIVAERIQDLATFTRLEGPESNISQVSRELRRSKWVHFAGHAIPNRKHPFDSAFGLHDGHFTVERIMGCELENPEFAYLSASHTMVGDEESTDEMIHLASAMQFAGFRSVIGTMWAVDDAYVNKIVSKFYENLVDGSGHLNYTRAAMALQKTMNSLGSVPLDQRIMYVHIGA